MIKNVHSVDGHSAKVTSMEFFGSLPGQASSQIPQFRLLSEILVGRRTISCDSFNLNSAICYSGEPCKDGVILGKVNELTHYVLPVNQPELLDPGRNIASPTRCTLNILNLPRNSA